MAIATFFHDDDFSVGAEFSLAATEAQHAAKSRRQQLGNIVQLINGRGQKALCEISELSKRNVSVKVQSFETTDQDKQQLTIATAIPKGDRQKVMLDMMTQLGVHRIIPLACEYSVTSFSDKLHGKWQRACIEACKQSQRLWFPSIEKSMSLQECVESHNDQNIAYADANGESIKLMKLKQSSEIETTIMIGPEGGFSAAEMRYLESKKISSVKLAGHILRTETASVTVAAQWQLA